MIDIVFPKAKPFPKQLFYFVSPPGTYSRHFEAKILEVDTMKQHFKIKNQVNSYTHKIPISKSDISLNCNYFHNYQELLIQSLSLPITHTNIIVIWPKYT